MEAGAQISPTHRCPGGSRAGDVFTTAFVEAFVGRCSYSGGLRPADCSHSLICEPASAWLALRKSSSRAGPGGSFLASSFSRLASSARRFSRDSFCLMRRRSMLLSPVLADPTPHGSALAIYNAWDRESVPQIELGHSAIRLRALGLKYRQYPRLEAANRGGLRQKNLRNILSGLYVHDGERESAHPPFPEIGQGNVARCFGVIETAAGISFDQLWHAQSVITTLLNVNSDTEG